MDRESLLWWLLKGKRRRGANISPRTVSHGQLYSVGEHKYSTGCGFGKGKSGNAESKLEVAFVPYHAGFILTTVSASYCRVLACVHIWGVLITSTCSFCFLRAACVTSCQLEGSN